MRLFTLLIDWMRGRSYQPVPQAPEPRRPTHEATPPSRPAPPDWKRSPAHLLALSKFLRTSPADFITRSDYWDRIFNESRFAAMDRFVKEGMVDIPPLEDRVGSLLKVCDLKVLLKRCGLKVGGKKADLVARLLEEHADVAEDAVAETVVLQCTPAGAPLAKEYLAAKASARERAEAETLQALDAGDIGGAWLVVSRFEATQVFPRGLGIDWSRGGSNLDDGTVGFILEASPGILSGATPEALAHLRRAAAMAMLWGVGEPRKWLPEGFDPRLRFDAGTAARMISSHAHQRAMIQRCRRTNFVVGMEVELGHTCDECGPCKRIAGCRYKLNDVPELPVPDCASDLGCTCRMSQVFQGE